MENVHPDISLLYPKLCMNVAHSASGKLIKAITENHRFDWSDTVTELIELQIKLHYLNHSEIQLNSKFRIAGIL